MRKAKYSFLTLFLIVAFAGFIGTVNAQFYTDNLHRCHLIYSNYGTTGPDALCFQGGTTEMSPCFLRISSTVRGVEQFNKEFTKFQYGQTYAQASQRDWYVEKIPGNEGSASSMPGNLAFSYKDLTNTCVIDAVAGQEFAIETVIGGHTRWANAVMYIDWDGNGVFDDHAPDEYDVYKNANFIKIEQNGINDGTFMPSWNEIVPKTFVEPKVVRVRLIVDEGLNDGRYLRSLALREGIVEGTNGACSSALSGVSQYFYSMYQFRFFPSTQLYRGTTVDIALNIIPDEYSANEIVSEQTVATVGDVACADEVPVLAVAINDEAGFEAFLNNPTADYYYLASDITLSSPIASNKEFSGVFDGQGHTITYSAATVTLPTGTSKDECFFPYGLTKEALIANLKSCDEFTGVMDMTNYPLYNISGGFCGKLAYSGTIKNVKIVYGGAVTYNSTNEVLFGLVAGIAKGRIENVSVDLQNNVYVQMTNSTKPSAVGGMAGILFKGVVKNCAVNIGGQFKVSKNVSDNVFGQTALGGFFGRMQGGIVGNVKFSGSGDMIMLANAADTYSQYYIGGIVGMTNTPKGVFCGNRAEKQLYWGYDNGATGLDVNNVILSYNGNMQMSAMATGTHNYYCRGLLFGEATDTIIVPNLITQYAAAPTIEQNASIAQSLSSIPLVSKVMGSKNSNQTQAPSEYVGKLYLYKDGRNPNNQSSCTKFTNITTADTELNWAYEVQNVRDEGGNVSCVAYSTPYAVATYTGTNANVQGIESASANVSDLGNTMVKIDPQPADVASPSWTWSETATPPAAEPIETPICGGGSCVGTPIKGLLSTYCSSMGNPDDPSNGTDRRISNIELNGSTVDINESSSDSQDAYRGTKNNEASAIELAKGSSYTLTVNGNLHWQYITCFADWNADGDFSDANERIGTYPNGVHVFDGSNAGSRSITINVPSTAASAYIPLRIKMSYCTNDNETAMGTPDPCSLTLYKEQVNQAVAADIVLKIVNTVGEVTCIETTYCTPASMTNNPSVTIASGFLSNLTANGTTLHTATTAAGDNQYQTGSTIIINQGDDLELDISINSLHGDNLKWAFALAFVDLNGDGDFSDSGERIYEQGGTGSDRWTGTKIDAKPWNTTKTITFDDPSVTNSMLRIFTIGEYNSGFAGNTNGSMAIYNTGCNTVAPNGYNSPANRFHCYDFPIVINSAVGGDGCAYVANFGDVYVGDVVTYDISLGAGFTALTDADGADEYELDYNDVTGKLTVTYNVPATPGAVAVDSIGGITKGDDVYRIAVSATVKAAPTVTFRIGENGGGLLSLDMGKTTSYLPYEIDPYKGQLLTAIPNGPTHIEGWYVSTDGGTTFNAVGHTNPDYTYTGADDAIVEVRFDFEKFEGNFGDSRFTVNTNPPYYISSITTTGGVLNVNATDVFTPATTAGGSAHMRYMEDERFQTLPASLASMQHTITVTMKNMGTFPADARLLCFIDYNYNNYFDFTSTADGLASGLTPNGELVFVGVSNGNAEQTFTFDINNDSITNYGKTRMRFLAATYVDMYGLGPVNQYGNYQPRIDTDGDGIADTNLPLNDNNGLLYTPENQCRYVNYVNVADVNFEVVAYIRSNDEYVIRNGESIRLGDLYIESVEDETGINSGTITFDKSAPYGSLSVEGNIIVRKRIYQDRWHDVAFPIAMQGTSGDKGVCAVAANSSLQKLPDNKWLLKQFNPTKRNNDGGYGKGLYDADKTEFAANTFYEFAADNVGGATLGNLDGTNYYWIQFHSVDQGFFINPSSAKVVTIPYTRDQESSEYNNRNVFTLHNPYLSPINVREITTSPGVGWENITWWNAARNGFVGVSAANSQDMPPYFGYWVQFTEGTEDPNDVSVINVVLGDVNRQDYAYPDDGIVNFAVKSAAKTSSFDTPDAYTLGIDRTTTAANKSAISSTIITLTDAGSIDEFRAGYDMPVSYAATKSTVPEIWSKAGSSRMMFNDVMRGDEVVVPVGIRIKEAGEYVVRLTHTNHSASLVQLYDKVTGSKVDLQRNEELLSYSFLAEVGDDERFELIIIAPNAMTDLDVIESDEELAKSAIYNVGSTLRLVNLPLGYSVAVCDVVGRELLQTAIVDTDMQLQLPSNQGVYLVNVRNEKGNSVQVVKLTR